MSTPISLFDYHLPPENIAQAPVEPRDSSRLLVLDEREKGRKGEEREGKGSESFTIEHRRFFEIVDYLESGDILVMNDTKVFKARLSGTVDGKTIEVFLLPSVGEGVEWKVLLKPGRKVKVGDKIFFGKIFAEVLEKFSDGTAKVAFDSSTPPKGDWESKVESQLSRDEVISFANEYGSIPVPPYVKKVPDKFETYQTVYARETGSVAAPTAGFHFTAELLEKIKEKGITIEFVTLHVGLGTFRPVKSETLEEHEMHSEFVEIKPEVAQRINVAKVEGRRIVVVGTTTTRALEGVALISKNSLSPDSYPLPSKGFFGEVNLFITPGFKFNVVDALITNFHLPKSTLLVLVSAFVGRENILAAYEEAIKLGYRFYSFGDAMFICGV